MINKTSEVQPIIFFNDFSVISIVEESPVVECVVAVWPETTAASVAASTETCPA